MFGSLLDFAKDVGKKLFTSDAEAAMNIHAHIEANNPGVKALNVLYDDGCVTLKGWADSQAAKEKCILMAGNVEGVERVEADMLEVDEPRVVTSTAAEQAPEASAPEAPAAAEAASPAEETRFYVIQRGDTLWKIASEAYGNGARYTEIVEANREVIEDPDKIYPGQKIRIP
jgi:nucleoid-associated protein YgaU